MTHIFDHHVLILFELHSNQDYVKGHRREGQKEPSEEPVKKLKACCSCLKTKGVRDQCIMENGEENCGDLIEAHKDCMRQLGFKL